MVTINGFLPTHYLPLPQQTFATNDTPQSSASSSNDNPAAVSSSNTHIIPPSPSTLTSHNYCLSDII
eukprot:jgi/Psemu1/45167/gm1.45167_g